MILIIGYKGGMGRRYSAILDYLDVPWVGADKEHSPDEILNIGLACTGVIIASPTNFHEDHLTLCAHLEVPVLCEKPFAKDLASVRRVLDLYSSHEHLSMVLQYYELIDPDKKGPSSYNYFRHGNDGIVWDCIQIVGLATDEVTLEETSPIWQCTLNGQELNIKDMDEAYIRNVQRWLKGDYLGADTIYDIHRKTFEFEKRFPFAQSSHRYSGSLNIETVPRESFRRYLWKTNASVGD